MTLTRGTRLGPYEIVAPLGAGGMGDVYRGRDTRLGREVAIKMVTERLTASPQARARFEREARAIAALSHPNIVALYDIGSEGNLAFVVMELLEGESLDRRLVSEPLPWRKAAEIAAAVADGLASAHARGIVHRDLKPANIFITGDGVVKIIDFGLAKSESLEMAPNASTLTATGAMFGTPGYMSPEQVQGLPADHRSDIFALGCVLYEMLAGRRPFPGNTPGETAAAILRDQPADLSQGDRAIPAHVDAVVHRCLAKNPNERFQSARDLAFTLRELLAGRVGSVGAPPIKRTTRRLAGIATGAFVVVALLWVGATVRSRITRSEPVAHAGSDAVTTSSHSMLPAAYDAYVRGRHSWEKRSEGDLRDAIRHFQDSIDADPTYAPAYAAMADAYGQLGYGSYMAPRDAFPLARAAAERALELNPGLAEAHASRGYALMYYDWSFGEAEAEYQRAIRLKPEYAVAHQWYAYLLTAMERPLADVDAEISAATNLDPLSAAIRTDRAYIYHYYGRNEDALRSAQSALEMNPKFAPGFFWLGRIYTSMGRYGDADRAFQAIGPLRTWTPAMAAIGYMYARAGRPNDARMVLKEFDALAKQGRYASGYAIAVIYAGLGDRDRALAYLDLAYGERSHWLLWLKRDPRWNAIRSDPRFQGLVRKVGLPD